MKIAVAEDIPANQLVIDTILRKLGHEADVFESGEALLRGLLAGDYDLVLMDVQMPKMNGLVASVDIRAGRVGDSLAEVYIVGMIAHAL